MKELGVLKFETEIFRDNGHSKAVSLGVKENVMTLYEMEKDYYMIEWEYGKNGFEQIGIYCENKTVVDYDGVFELPKESIKLLRQNKIHVPRDFEQ